jgi:uncharacterized protein (TIGR03118 family)
MLASDVPGLARVTDPNLVNPWGIAFSPTGPFWFADNGSGVSDLLDGRGQPVPLVVTVPGGTPTGTVFNGGPGFAVAENSVAAPSRFLFATEGGTISGWTAVVDPTHALPAVENSSTGAVYKGLALATDPAGRSFLYAADFGRGTIDVFNQDFKQVAHPGSFRDPALPDGFAPFNIQNLNNLLFVTYAQQDGARHDDVAGAGHGFIDVYDTGGDLVTRFASRGALDSPWGLALAPAAFGPFGGALLVGNNGDGHINAYDPRSGAFLGSLADDSGAPVTVPDLWALTFGNGHEGGAADTLFFTAGVDSEAHGLFGALQAPGRRGADTAGPGAFDPNAPGEPGDYPLQPSGGPAFRAGSAGRPIPLADLLPLRESSLVLIPTLSTLLPSGTRMEAPVPAAPSRVSGEWWVATANQEEARLPTHRPPLTPPAEDSQPEWVDTSHTAALNTFLDLNPSVDAPQKEAEGHRPGTHRPVVGARSSPSAVSEAEAEGLLAEAYAGQRKAQSSAEQGARTLSLSGQADEGLAAAPPERRAESADERAGGNESVATQSDGGWTKPMNLLFAVSLPMIWIYWLRREMKLRQSSGDHAGGLGFRCLFSPACAENGKPPAGP